MSILFPGIQLVTGPAGHFRVGVFHPDGTRVDITMFRDVPIQINSFSTADPFGDSTASIGFPQVTPFDRTGSGDLWWWVPWAKIEIRWYEYDPVKHRSVATDHVWEGNIVSEEIGEDLSLSAKGCLYMSDNYLAAPFFPEYPITYEQLIGNALNPDTHPTGNQRLQISWPAGWNVKVPDPKLPGYLWYLRPWKVRVGEKWTGLTTRSTGGWDAVLTGFIQGLLGTMYTPDGDQWTLMKKPGRIPELRVRTPMRDVDDATVEVVYGLPGIKANLSRDFTQSSNVIYATGTDIAGTAFSGAQVAPDGSATSYQPFAYLPQVHPVTNNPRKVSGMVRKESRMQFSTGVDAEAAKEASYTQLRRFADPGYTGSVTLDIDPMQNGQPVNRMLLSAGGTLLLKGFRGTDILLHIASADVSVSSGSVSLTVDSKFRDALTIAEIRARTRDAMQPTNAMKVGHQSQLTPDMMKPWSYAEGSGIIPSGTGTYPNALPLFKKMGPGDVFPWTKWTTAYPPKKYPQYYIKVSRKGPKADDRWQDQGYTSSAKRSISVPIKMAEKGNIQLSQIMAVDRDGHPIQIRFHLGIYNNDGVTSLTQPTIPANVKNMPYPPAQHYPFFPNAYETTNPIGEALDGVYQLGSNAGEMVLWGSYYEPAGYSPGLYSAKAPKTGMLVDESQWQFNSTEDKNFSPTSLVDNMRNKLAGQLYVMIFQDDVQEAWFIGRLFHVPNTGNTS